MAIETNSELVAMVSQEGTTPADEGWVCTYPVSSQKWCEEDAPHKIPNTNNGLCAAHYGLILLSGGQVAGIGDGTIFKGMGASQGVVEGIAIWTRSATQFSDDPFPEGHILITTMTTPDLVGAMRNAAAIVTSRGGRLCHAAIVSREFRVPCVVGVTDMEVHLSALNGKRIKVDGKSGTVEVIANG